MDTAVSDKNALVRSIEQVTVRWFLSGIGGWTSPVAIGFPHWWPHGLSRCSMSEFRLCRENERTPISLGMPATRSLLQERFHTTWQYGSGTTREGCSDSPRRAAK